MNRTLARALAASAMGIAMVGSFAATPAHAAPVVDKSWNVDATTTLKKLNTTVALPTGSLTAKIDLATGDMTGDLAIPQATQTLKVGNLPVATVTVALHQTAPITGNVDLDAGTASTSASFNVQVVSIRPVSLPWLNLISGPCTTKTPATASLAGPINLGGVTEFSGTYALPKFEKCGFATSAINAVLPGSGNTMNIKLSN